MDFNDVLLHGDGGWILGNYSNYFDHVMIEFGDNNVQSGVQSTNIFVFTALLLVGIIKLLITSTSGDRIQDGQHSEIRRLKQRRWLLGFDVALTFASWIRNNVSLEESAKWISENGKTFSVLIAGRKNVWTADALNAKAILSDSARAFELSHAREIAFRPVIGKGMIAVNGAVWKSGRKLLTQSLGTSTVRNIAQYESYYRNLLSQLPVDGSTVNLRQLLLLYTMDTASLILLGDSTAWLTETNKEEVELISEAMDHANDMMRFRGDIGWLVYLHWTLSPKFRQTCSKLRNFVYSQLTRQATINKSPVEDEEYTDSKRPFVEAFTSSLANQRTVSEQLLTSLMAGRDTTASLMGFTIWSLSRDKRVQKALRAALEGMPNPVREYSSLAKVTYLWHVIKEGKTIHGHSSFY
jgi:cytochrome P450